MNFTLSGVKRLHRCLVDQSFYPLALSSILAIGFLAVRMGYFRSPAFVFLAWNLFLAWIPFSLSFFIARLHESDRSRRWVLLVPAAAWLVFFPNAPYILTDILHLRPGQFGWWYDMGMILTFAWAGLSLGVASLRTMHEVVRDIAGSIVGWAFVLVTVLLSGLGIYLGRFLRWNSWDVLTQPQALVADLMMRISEPHNHPRTVGVTLMFASFLFVCYITFAASRRAAPGPR